MSDAYDIARSGFSHPSPSPAVSRPFVFDGFDVRAFEMDDDGWFVAKDIALVLGYANPQKAVRDHCKAARPAGVNVPFTPLDPQTIIIPERDVYRLVMRSKLPSAEEFEEWVMRDVLPAIRKTGGYTSRAAERSLLPDPSDTDGLLRLLAEQVQGRLADRRRAADAEAYAAELAPKAAAHDRIADLRGTFTRTAAAKILGVPPNVLMTWMANNGWTYTRTGGTDVLAHQAKLNAGLLENKIAEGRDGATWRKINVHVTPKGLTVLAKAFPPLLQIAGAA